MKPGQHAPGSAGARRTAGQRPAFLSLAVRPAFVRVAKLAFGFGILGYVIRSGRVDPSRIVAAGPVIAGAACLLAVPLLGWLRWWLVVRAQGIRLGLYPALRIYLIGVFFNAFLLGSVGGDALKAYYLAAGAGASKRPESVATILLDRFYGFLGLMLLVGGQLPFAWRALSSDPEVKLAAGIIASAYLTALVVAVILIVPPLRAVRRRGFDALARRGGLLGRAAAALSRADEALQIVIRRPLTSAACVLMSFAAHFMTVVAFYLFGMALGEEGVPFAHYVVLTPLVLAAAALPVLPLGGIGVAELFSSAVFGAGAGLQKWFGGTIMLLWRLGMFVPGPVGLVYFVLHRRDARRTRKEHVEPHAEAASDPPVPPGLHDSSAGDARNQPV